MTELLAARLDTTGRYRPTVLTDPHQGIELLGEPAAGPFSAVVVELSFDQAGLNGLDVLVAFQRRSPSTALVVHTLGTALDWPLLEIAWSAIQPLSVLAKQAPVADLLADLDLAVRAGRPRVAHRWRERLDATSSRWRTEAGYRSLVPHAGHAKLWDSLLRMDRPPTYEEVARHSGLSVNTIRNYRADLLVHLRLHGLDNPSLHEMFDFARRTRPLLAPVVAGKRVGAAGSPRAVAPAAGRARASDQSGPPI